LALAYGGVAYASRFVRASLLEGATTTALRTARARGRSAFGALRTHGLKRAAVPLLTLAGFLLPRLIGGSVVVERIYGLHGIGGLFFDSLMARDVPTVLGLTIVSATAVLAGVLLADVAYAMADPRTRGVQ